MGNNSQKITDLLLEHYTRVFAEHGRTPRGVDWRDKETAELRYQKMLALLDYKGGSLLDVGCGFGGLLEYISQFGASVSYVGIDIVEEMLQSARSRHSSTSFVHGDFLTQIFDDDSFDYVVCNGILTQKLAATEDEMSDFAKKVVTKMFRIAKRGIAFNLMTNYVNYTVPNLYYTDPSETLRFCQASLSPHVRIDHAYRLYEYTTYVYK